MNQKGQFNTGHAIFDRYGLFIIGLILLIFAEHINSFINSTFGTTLNIYAVAIVLIIFGFVFLLRH